jgi:hypothetical protein
MIRQQQEDLGGMEGPGIAPVKIKEIDKHVALYTAARDEHGQVTEKLTNAKKLLIEVMHKHEAEITKDANGELIYRCGDEVVTVKPGKEDLKVKTAPLEA